MVHQTGEYYEENSQTYHHPSFSSHFHASLRSKELLQTLVCSLMHMYTISYGPSAGYYLVYLFVVDLCSLIKLDGIVKGMKDGD